MQSLRSSLSAHHQTDVDEIVGDHTEPDPSPHSVVAFVSAAVEAVSPFDDTNAASLPVHHFSPLRNQRFFCSRFRSRLLVERLGMHTHLTPSAFAVASFLPE